MVIEADPLGLPIKAVACMKTLAPRDLKSSAVPILCLEPGATRVCNRMCCLASAFGLVVLLRSR